MVAVCHYVPRTNSNLELVYLLPQLEEKDEANNQVTPPGFHVVFCPFKEDMRDLSAVDHSASGKCSVASPSLNNIARVEGWV